MALIIDVVLLIDIYAYNQIVMIFFKLKMDTWGVSGSSMTMEENALSKISLMNLVKRKTMMSPYTWKMMVFRQHLANKFNPIVSSIVTLTMTFLNECVFSQKRLH